MNIAIIHFAFLDMKPPIKVESTSTSSTPSLENNPGSAAVKSEVKNEIKAEEKVGPIGNSVNNTSSVVGARGAVSHQVTARTISSSNPNVKEEEYDSSATVCIPQIMFHYIYLYP